MAADPALTFTSQDSSCVRFVLDGEFIEARDVPPTTTVLEYLRETLGRKGTKEGCAEGDCGACTVVLGKLSEDRSQIRYTAVNSCIRYLPTIDGHELVTVESLQQGDALHPIQQSLIEHHASQCGFCTPGFVMSLFALYLNSESPSRDAVVDALAGNLCRCTGYRPIIDAGCAMGRYADPQQWSRADSQSETRLARLRGLQRVATLDLDGYLAPQSLDELLRALERTPDSLLLAGGTDIGLWTTKHLQSLPPLIYIGEVKELQHVDVEHDGIRIGAAVSLTQAWQVIVQHFPSLEDLTRRFASPPVCNSGTLCGNLANGSPIGDSMPALTALGASVELRSSRGVRSIPLESFYLGYQQKDLRPGEFISHVRIPYLREGQRLACYKVSKRFDQDISAVCAAFLIELEDDHVRNARFAFGGMAAIPKRASQAEASMMGQRWTRECVERAASALEGDFDPLTDMRASAGYRLEVAANLLRRFHRATHDDDIGVHSLAVMS